MKLFRKNLITGRNTMMLAAALALFGFLAAASAENPLANIKGLPKPTFKIKYTGSEFLIDYNKYGKFINVGTPRYKYVVSNYPKLIKAAGEGITPNIDWIKKDSTYLKLRAQNAIFSHWDKKKDPATEFFTWTTAWEEWGVRQFFTGITLKDNGYLIQALKAFYAVIVHYPKSACYAADQSYVWYVVPAAMQQIEIILSRYPQLPVKYEPGTFHIENGDDTDLRNDIITVTPGRLVSTLVGMENPDGYPAEEFKTETRDVSVREKKLVLTNPGEDMFIDYSKYGTFENIGKDHYKYMLKDTAGLAKAVGEGIWPNTEDIKKNPLYKLYDETGWLQSSHWENINHFRTPTLMYVSWASTGEDPGRKLFYTAEALKFAGYRQNDLTLLRQAIKAYHAILIHFPGTVMYAPDNVYLWYVAHAAISKIYYILRKYPELKTEYRDGFVKITNEYDILPENDIVSCHPGTFAKKVKDKSIDLSKLKVKQTRGKGTVQLRQYENGHWQMFVEGKPQMIQSVLYAPTTIGDSPHDMSERNWMFVDENYSGKADGPYEAWVDKNRNDKRDKDEPDVGDFQLLKEMGVNAIRFYHKPRENKFYNPKEFDKEVLRDMYKTYGLRAVLGDLLGAYTVGSGADWFVGTDYRDEKQKEYMKNCVRDLVMDHKDEPYVLMYLLGNENNMNNQYGGVNATKTLAGVYPVAYAKFLNEVCAMIHELDPNHPVGLGNLETQLIEYYQDYAPEIDILGVNSYRGPEGFGNLYNYVARVFDRPVVITEFGSDVLFIDKDTIIIDEQSQADYHAGAWDDIMWNSAGNGGQGNAIGAMIFEWMDEWWKSNLGPKEMHQWTRDSPMAFQDGWSSEEWLGLNGQGLGYSSPFMRQPRKAYYFYKKAYNMPYPRPYEYISAKDIKME